MKVANGVLGFTLGLAFSGPIAWAQSTTSAAKPEADAAPKSSDPTRTREYYNSLPVQTFYLNNDGQPNDGNEIQTAVRNILSPDTKIYFLPSQNAIVVRAPADQFALVQKLLNDLDRPRKSYRLTYTITEVEGGKRVSTQHFTLMPADGQRVTLKQGSKVPIATGSSSAGASPAGVQTQFQYLDVGMTFDATLTGIAGGGLLKTKVEQTGVAEEKSGVGAQDPVIRQTSLEGTSILTLDKPLMLGSVDVPGSTRHLDVEVVMELVK